ncbi:Hypothetical predicted protein [Cloeon dipterum]|uniref:Oxysterol-binding protein n=1 Tax=Cloeon dipterum TaxID=197152 RepID=A0A8S1E9S7_9INSE|nr:Hypothetical predicted protein [Cloeon dipterum]
MYCAKTNFKYYCSQWKLQEAAQRAENWAQASRVSNKPGFADAWALRDERRAEGLPQEKKSRLWSNDLVLLLLERGASVGVINGEGQTPRHVTDSPEVAKLLLAAEQTDIRRREERLLAAARAGKLDAIHQMLRSESAPNINCVDNQGNTCLHCAAYRGHKEVAVLLLQNGIDTKIKNNRGQTALDLAKDEQMNQVLSVQPVRRLLRSAARFEGMLLKRSRFLGWKPIWVVLERGVMAYFACRADACSGVKRKDFKYLDNARMVPIDSDECSFLVNFSDSTVHRLSVVNDGDDTQQISRQKWLNALQEHAAFSSHYLSQGQASIDEEDDEPNTVKPLGSMQDALQTAAAHHQVLAQKLADSSALLDSAQSSSSFQDMTSEIHKNFQMVSDSAASMLGALGHCLTLFQQQEEVRVLQLRQEQERVRVLEEALHVLAREHHELEQSVAMSQAGSPPNSKRSSRLFDPSDDEFYDAFEADSDSDTLVTAASPDSDTLRSFNIGGGGLRESASSCTLVSGAVSPVSNMSFHSALDRPHSRRTSTPMGHRARAAMAGRDPEYQPTQKHLRQTLPVPMFSQNDFNLWSVLKNCIGKELSKITMPVIFNEPLSFLQRMVEYMEYSYLLRVASEQEDPVDRMKYVAAFAVSALSSNWERLGKPFNPLLGETYELERDDFRVVCEQVSHHPPVSAFHADSPHFIFHGSIYPKLKFWGKDVAIQPKGTVTVELPRWGEAYTWSNVNCYVHNIIVGKLWMEQSGSMEIVNHRTGHRATLTFKPAGWFSKELHRVEGYITDNKKNKLFFLYGRWTDFIRCTDIESYDAYFKENTHKFRKDDKKSGGTSSPSHSRVLKKLNSLKSPFKSSRDEGLSGGASFNPDDPPPPPEVPEGEIPKSDSTYSIDIPNSTSLWEVRPRPPNTSDYFQFTLFAMSLNEMEPAMKEKLCLTDCRLRPDIRLLEEGDIDGAAAEKTRLEEKQRDTRKSLKAAKEEDPPPRWFCQGTNPYTRQEDWLYSGGYWDRNFEGVSDIF